MNENLKGPENAQAMRPSRAMLGAQVDGIETRDDQLRRQLPRRFLLYRDVDETGISGTGIVAHGVQFGRTGQCFMEWVTPNTPPTWGMYAGMYALIQVHGHKGKTRILYPDDECTAAIMVAEKLENSLHVHRMVWQCAGDPGHDGDHGDAASGIRWGDDSRGAIPPIALEDRRFRLLSDRAQHLMDVYGVLGVRWGSDIFAAIKNLQEQAAGNSSLGLRS